MKTQLHWQTVASAKRASIDSLVRAHLPPGVTEDSIPSPKTNRDGLAVVRELLSTSELEITELSLNKGVSPLLTKLADGSLSAVDVITAFIRRAALAHCLTNCLSEVLFKDALKRAKELDEHISTNGKAIGPLHGLPVSLKDQFRVDGAETSLGYVGWLGRAERAADESLVVGDLKKLGAVVICKTNVPSSLMAIETNNNIIGNTLGARNRLLSSGGSSGGEAALLALGGAAVGFGSDIAASIRLPSCINGTCGLKPSEGRLSYKNVANSEIIKSVIGPMGNNVGDLELLTKTLLNESPWARDPQTLPLPWRQSASDEIYRLAAHRQLTFAVFEDDGIVKPLPPVARVLRETVRKLKAAGHEVIQWEPPHHGEALALLFQFFLHDGGQDIHKAASASGEPLIPQLSAYFGTEPHLPVKSVHEVWNLVKQRDAYRDSYVQYWNKSANLSTAHRPVDFVLLPCSPTPGYEFMKSVYMGYTGVANVLDFAAVAINAGYADAELDVRSERENYHSDMDKTVWEQWRAKYIAMTWRVTNTKCLDDDPQLFDNTPIGIQVMGRRLEEERVLAAAREVERCINNDMPGRC